MLLAGLGACSTTDVWNQFGGRSSREMAESAFRGGSPNIALDITNEMLRDRPNNATVLTLQGDALTALGRDAEATASFEAALRCDPSKVRAKLGLGRLRLATNPAEAEVLFLEVLQKTPRDTIALNNLGIARDMQGRHEDARLAYRQALGIDPSMVAARVNLAVSISKQDTRGRALPLAGAGAPISLVR